MLEVKRSINGKIGIDCNKEKATEHKLYSWERKGFLERWSASISNLQAICKAQQEMSLLRLSSKRFQIMRARRLRSLEWVPPFLFKNETVYNYQKILVHETLVEDQKKQERSYRQQFKEINMIRRLYTRPNSRHEVTRRQNATHPVRDASVVREKS